MLFKGFEEQVDNRHLDDIPNEFDNNKHAQAYFGVFKKVIPEGLTGNHEDTLQRWIDLAFSVDDAVIMAVNEHSINPQNIEAEIRKKLLPVFFKECKMLGSGMDQAKAMLEMVIQITRVGLNAIRCSSRPQKTRVSCMVICGSLFRLLSEIPKPEES